ncbi:hypothetical protein IMY05_C4482000200 [Salix suchowensis]|nr:hypothetical protein IMY05_C4482000200 [Salix suchowensis]
MAPNPPLTSAEVLKVTRASVNILRVLRYDFCLFGSAASNYYGMSSRVAQDVDILVLAWDVDAECSRENLSNATDISTRSTLRSREQTTLFCGTSSWHAAKSPTSCSRRDSARFPSCRSSTNLPKLIGWRKRARSILPYWRKKVLNDEEDLLNLLEIAISRPDIGRLSSVPWITTAFRRRARLQISRFVQKYPDSIAKWRILVSSFRADVYVTSQFCLRFMMDHRSVTYLDRAFRYATGAILESLMSHETPQSLHLSCESCGLVVLNATNAGKLDHKSDALSAMKYKGACVGLDGISSDASVNYHRHVNSEKEILNERIIKILKLCTWNS